MTPEPHVSIVICTYNRSTSLQTTLACVDAQQTPSDLVWELIVVDNNSTDATRAIVERFAAAARMPVRGLFVGDQGLSRARNAGLAVSRGAIVGFTDDDVDPAPDWVARIAATLAGGGPDIVGGRILPAWGTSPPAWLADRAFHGLLCIMDHPDRVDVVNARRQPCVWGANMAFRREVFDRVGVFDVRLGIRGSRRYGGEETDLVGRALAAGYRAVYDPALVVWHRIGSERMRIVYLSRLAFDRAEGEARVQPHVARPGLLGVPLGLYWSMAKRLGGWMTAVARRRPDAIQRWLECCRCLGAMWAAGRRQWDDAGRRPLSDAG